VPGHSPSIDRTSPSSLNRFASVRLDRLVDYRDDADWVREAAVSASARFVPLWRNRSLIARAGDGQVAVYLRPEQLQPLDPAAPTTLLGTDGKRIFFAATLDDQQQGAVLEYHPDARFLDLRLASVDMDAKHAGVLAYAKALHYWHWRHRYCGVCGAPNRQQSAGHKLLCTNPDCARESFPRIDPAIIVLVTQGDACLLGHNALWPPRRYSTLAGFVEPGESLEDAVVREVYEESRVRLGDISYVSSQPWPFPASAMCGFQAEAASRDCAPSDEMESLLWLNPAELVAALRSDAVRLPPPVSIAFQLISGWYREQCGGDLEALVRDAGSWLERKRIE
jgi:NAD+ diphosphatase